MTNIPITKFPKIETERLILNQPLLNDIKNIVDILNDETYSKNTINIPFPYTIKSAKFWVELAKQGFENKTQYIFAIRTKENSKIIGGIDLGIELRFNKAELGYWLDNKYWNHGYMTEAVKAVINFGFEKLKLKRIYATHFDFNPASGKVMQKCGMEKEGVLKCHTCKNGEYQNHILYSVINE
ncbi:GNAT family N-acetyltransferase [Riemerella anatipestifer]|uniref:GNAT family N-acetyltransferase n=2 Tax=Riemerella anatipestifer TaxID=34085 RepID=UPI000D68E62D|nr:GNAT family protein [Riemerella anatipestifer]MCO7319823.1 GNAT family N-acetyltransferase [Riemerella anatipestifer]MCQ4156234.1 GNAT family N-acetyltransferase [Riemerella anatipestifer]MCQ4182091.1 GNAT family N-acetyltransferase [Riemerella anatipestifer]MCU7568886.1 GNAT family N-acetyltransferase [Riemerella anatipestifer]MCW0475319.1 GNAT family N-acetyltransferase [Riemerella anatipestifer]